MPRDAADDLTPTEKRDLIKLINEGRPLPEKYRFILFADKREVELVWSGKTREVCTTSLPFQTLEHIDEPRKEKANEDELALDTGGRQVKGWTNKPIWGDNKLILASLKSGGRFRPPLGSGPGPRPPAATAPTPTNCAPTPPRSPSTLGAQPPCCAGAPPQTPL